ncbi:MAG: FAD-dependent oxidoreductase [Caldilineaceae bacterium]
MRTDYDYIVLGCGGIGSAALYWLARRAGADVLGIEQFQLYHSNGSSQDYSRIIRHYYHKDCYKRLTPQMYEHGRPLPKNQACSP